MFQRSPLVACACFLLASSARLASSDHEVILNEIHYNPLGGDQNSNLEFLELHNLGTSEVDLGGWSFGEGIGFTCPPGLVIGPKEYLVFSPAPDEAKARYGIPRAAGPYTGRLDNNGEIVSLLNASGRLISRVHYGDDGVWPSLADGDGPSLEFTGEDNANDRSARWRASWAIGGTPGARNSRFKPPPPPVEPNGSDLIPAGAAWRTFKGTSAPSAPATAWTALGFADAGWAELPGGFGYGTGNGFTFATALDDMAGRYTTFYIRHAFDLTDADLAAILAGEKSVRLHVTYDDAFVAYVNGTEVGRDNVGSPGTPVSFDASANEARAAQADIALDPFKAVLKAGTNVVAVQGVNFFILGRDFFIGAELGLETGPPPPPPEEETPLVPGVINEYRPGASGAAPGFIELFNPTAAPLDLSGFHLRLGSGESFQLPAGAALAQGAFRVFDAAALGFPVPAAEGTCVLLEPDGATLADAIKVDPSGAGNSVGRFPDGAEDVFVMTSPTSGAPNVHGFVSPVVLNEIHFHPPFVPPGGGCAEKCSDDHQWIELWNRGPDEVDLTGWSVSKGVNFDFQAGTKIAAGQALVVAASVQVFKVLHPGVDRVVGDWSGRLSHGSDTINLRDALGNRVDHVKYGDGGPTNDEAPDDGTDDRTFRGSTWPSGADGTGRTLELVNPALENKLGLAWLPSSATGGTPGAQNSVFDATPGPVIDSVEHSPAVPRSAEPVTVTCRIDVPGGLASAVLEWARDGAAFTSVALRDDGGAPDKAPGDGVFSALIPAQADGSVVRFRIVLLDQAGASLTVPVPPAVPPYGGFEGPFYLYEVDDSSSPANGLPSYRIVMAQRDLQELGDRDVNSDVLLPATFIADGGVKHLAGIRYRGETSRREANRSYRVEFPAESRFDGVDHLNLNGSNGGNLGTSSVTEILAADLFRRAGAPYPQMQPVNLHFPGEVSRNWDSRYARKENFDDLFLERFFGGSDGGNLYRARNPGGPGAPSGNLSYLGEDPNAYRDLYEKKSNREEDDFSDIIDLTRIFDPAQTPDNVFADELETWIDAEEWVQFFALQSILTNNDGGIWSDNGEDYFLYRVPDDSPRPDAGRFLLLPWDIEETFTDAAQRLFAPGVPSIRRFLSHPRFAQLFYRELGLLREGPFSRLEMRRSLGFVGSMFSAAEVFNVVDPLDSYLTDRIGYLDENVSPGLVAGPINTTVSGTIVIAPGDTWKFFRGIAAPAGGDFAWTESAYDDASWESGPTGIGYADGDDATVLNDMQDSYTTVFARKTFQVADPTKVVALGLFIDYDDAFVAYVNGVEIARSANAPGAPDDPVPFNSTATATHEAGTGESYEVAASAVALVPGVNWLAVVVMNERAASSDLSFIPALALATAETQGGVAGGCGGPIHATGSEVLLGGTADPVAAQAVRVNGALASFSYVTGGPGPFGALWSLRVGLQPGDNAFRITVHPDAAGQSAPVETADLVVRRIPGSFTQVGGTLAVNTVWTAAGGPYRLMQTVQVPPAGSLTIEAGAVVLAQGGAGIVARGQLTANGTKENPIHFTAFTCDAPWGGIVLADTGTGDAAPVHMLKNCVFEHGTNQQNAGGVIAPVNSKMLLEGCTLRSLTSNALDGTDAFVQVRGCLFEDIYEGVHCTRSAVIIEDSVFRHMIGDNDAIDFDGTSLGRSRIERCVIEDSTDDGIDLAQASVDIRDCVLSGVADKAISLEGNGSAGGPSLVGNIIHSSGIGIALKDGVTAEGDHDTITMCQEGINLFAKDAGPRGGHGIFHSMIVWGNVVNVLLDAKSSVDLAFSDLGGDEAWPGEGNIATSPRFMASSIADFALQPDSPCIQKGKDGTDMGAVPFTGPQDPVFLRGDSNENGRVDLSDAIATLRYLFGGGDGPACTDRMDTDDDGRVNITDPIYALAYLFQGGPSIKLPYPDPGVDPTRDGLVCEP